MLREILPILAPHRSDQCFVIPFVLSSFSLLSIILHTKFHLNSFSLSDRPKQSFKFNPLSQGN